MHTRTLLAVLALATFQTTASAQNSIYADEDGPSSASCIFGANGQVVYAPPGADCGKVAVATAAPKESDFAQPAPIDTTRWLPAEPGLEKLFVHVEEHTQSSLGPEPIKRVLQGTRHDVFSPAPRGYSDGALVHRITTRVTAPGSPENLETDRHVVVPHGNAYQIVASNVDWLGSRKDVKYETPQEALPAQLAKGAVWDAGSGQIGNVKLTQRGEVLGFQNARTPSGSYEKCLVVRYRGAREGVGQLDGQPYKITSSEITRTEWIAKGIGVVLSKEEIHESYESSGKLGEVHIRTQSGLQGMKRPGVPANKSNR